MAEISAAFPAVIIDNGTNRKSYRCTQDIQIGDTGVGTATTTLADTNVDIFFDSGKTLRARTTQQTSWYLRLGTKVGTGDKASGKDGCMVVLSAAPAWPQQYYLYGCTIRQTSGQVNLQSADGISEAINCLIQSSVAGAAPIALGTSTGRADNLYNVDISHSTTSQVLNNFGAVTAERLTIAAAAPTAFLLTGAPSVTIKDLGLFGSPTQSDLRWSTSAGVNWQLIRPIWSGNAAKFSAANAGVNIAVANACVEYWIYDVKCVDGTGAGVSGLPVKVTDNIGNVQVDTTTDSNGRTSFGSGITENALAMMDHYAVSGTYTQRHRGPFLTEVNMSYQAGYNPNYFSHRYYWRPPGYDTITTSAGSFEDVTDIVQMSAPSSGASTWVERVVP